MTRANTQPVMRRISSSRCFSRNTASPGVSPGREQPAVLHLAVELAQHAMLGPRHVGNTDDDAHLVAHLELELGLREPLRPADRYRDLVSPTDWAPGRISLIDTCRCWVCGHPSMRRYVAASSSGGARSRSIAPSRTTRARSTLTSEAVSTAARAGDVSSLSPSCQMSAPTQAPEWYTTSPHERPGPPSSRRTCTRSRGTFQSRIPWWTAAELCESATR